MATEYLKLEQAAAMLRLSPEKITAMISQQEIHGYRDGSSWKFKMSELERVADELGVTLGSGSGVESALELDDLLGGDDADADVLGDLENDPDEADSLLVSEEELGHSGETTSSTIIGKQNAAGGDSDLSLHPESDVIGSDLVLGSESGLGSSVLGGGSGILSDAGSAIGQSGDDDLVLSSPSGSGTGDLELEDNADSSGGLELSDGGGTGDLLDGDSDGGLELSAGSGTGDLDVDSELTLDSGGLELDDDELSLSDDDDLVLGDSSTAGSDITMDASDTGINLTNPADSGLSLEEHVELGSSVSSLELPEDEGLVALDGEMAGPDEATQLKQDEEFLLSPSADDGDDEDSGSQVIALDDSASFDQDANTMLNQDAFAGAGAGALDGGASPLEAEMVADAGDAALAPATAGGMVPAALPEAPYSIWNVLGLMIACGILAMTGMLMFDVVRNMWTWQSGSPPVTSSLMDGLISMLNLNP